MLYHTRQLCIIPQGPDTPSNQVLPASMAENKPPPKQSSSLGYSIHFEPDKPWKESPVPRCLKDYTTKPIPSRTQLLEKQEKAFRRRKVETWL